MDKQRKQDELAKLDSIEEIREQLRVAVESGDERSESVYLIKLGNIYAENAEFSLSDTMHRQALAITRDISDPYLEIVALANLGLSFKKRLEYSQAYTYYQKALYLARKTNDRNFEGEILKLMDELEKMLKLDGTAGANT